MAERSANDRRILLKWIQTDHILRQDVDNFHIVLRQPRDHAFQQKIIQQRQHFFKNNADFAYTKDDSRKRLATAIYHQTNQLTLAKKIEFVGGDAGYFLDFVCDTLFSAGLSFPSLASTVEEILGFAFNIEYGLSYENYQMGVEIELFGRDISRATLRVDFAPIPKIIKS